MPAPISVTGPTHWLGYQPAQVGDAPHARCGHGFAMDADAGGWRPLLDLAQVTPGRVAYGQSVPFFEKISTIGDTHGNLVGRALRLTGPDISLAGVLRVPLGSSRP